MFTTYIFFAVLAIQFIFLLFFFLRVVIHKKESTEETSKQEGVSVVVAAWNELENLKVLLPILDNQNYPNYEVIIVDDRSDDGTYDYLLTELKNFKHIRSTRIDQTPSHITAKKFAITLGLKQAQKPLILLTDADCRPASANWISQMQSRMGTETEIVIGFSPYEFCPTFLNRFIRFETFYTALQYFSFALTKLPYMGVGRNLMYRKELFFRQGAFTSHWGVMGGDDDLFVNAAANSTNTNICLEENSFTTSIPKETFDDWKTQKRRHLSVGKSYKLRDKILLGLLSMSHIFAWLLFPLTFFAGSPAWFVAPEWARIPHEWLQKEGLMDYYPFSDWMRLVLGVWFFWWLLRTFILIKASKKIGKTIGRRGIILMDFIFLFYLIFMGIYSIFSRKQQIRWK